MAQFILATETEDEVKRDSLMAEILKYNEEDLAATWAVLEWLRKKNHDLAQTSIYLSGTGVLAVED
jgi:predicted RecB family nuclease